jgi:hypothetical protein
MKLGEHQAHHLRGLSGLVRNQNTTRSHPELATSAGAAAALPFSYASLTTEYGRLGQETPDFRQIVLLSTMIFKM